MSPTPRKPRTAAKKPPAKPPVEPEVEPEEQPEPEPEPVRIDATLRAVPFKQRWAAAQAEVGRIAKRGRNTQQNYDFASVEDILDAIRGPLLTRGIVLTQTMDHNLVKVEEITASSGAKGQRMTVWVDFTLRDAWSDETIEAHWPGVGEDYGDKAIGKALTSAMKTWLRGTWLLPTGDDPEASAPQAPWWQLDANGSTRTKAIADLTDLLGRDNAKVLVDQLAVRFDGSLPVAALVGAKEVTIAWAAIMENERQAVAARKAAQEAPVEPKKPEPPFPTDEEAGVAPGPVYASQEAPLPAPGSIMPPVSPEEALAGPATAGELFRAAGCICSDPLAEDPVAHRIDCPIAGHGIPYDKRTPEQPQP